MMVAPSQGSGGPSGRAGGWEGARGRNAEGETPMTRSRRRTPPGESRPADAPAPATGAAETELGASAMNPTEPERTFAPEPDPALDPVLGPERERVAASPPPVVERERGTSPWLAATLGGVIGGIIVAGGGAWYFATQP